jgi:murein DD-endopeptidase MepM/ murein hydrolase activator NlpD
MIRMMVHRELRPVGLPRRWASFADPLRRDTLTIGRPVAFLFAAVFAVAVTWAAVATWAFIFRDEVVSRLIHHQSELRHSYEDRLRDFRNRLDSVTGQQVVDQEAYDQRMMDLLKRQVQLEDRQAVVDSLVRRARLPASVSADAGAGPNGGVSIFTAPEKPPVNGVSISAPAPATPTNLGVPALPPRLSRGKYSLSENLERADRFASAMDGHHLETLKALSSIARREAAQLKDVIAEIGLDPDKIAASAQYGGQGGPYIPVSATSNDLFTRTAIAAQVDLASLDRLRRTVDILPLRRPAPDSAITSGFGFRIDPFTRAPALHPGIDFGLPEGTAVYPTGAGRVTVADMTAGYGKMVEIDHGNGIVTRYAHLSEIDVRPGMEVTTDTQIGRVGTTGRSTGPHLHYETRISGEAVNPTRFLRAADMLASLEGKQLARSAAQSMSSTTLSALP